MVVCLSVLFRFLGVGIIVFTGLAGKAFSVLPVVFPLLRPYFLSVFFIILSGIFLTAA